MQQKIYLASSWRNERQPKLVCILREAGHDDFRNPAQEDHGFSWRMMLQPCERSAVLELGWAIGAGKRTAALMTDGQEPELMLRLADLLTMSVDELLTWLAAI